MRKEYFHPDSELVLFEEDLLVLGSRGNLIDTETPPDERDEIIGGITPPGTGEDDQPLDAKGTNPIFDF